MGNSHASTEPPIDFSLVQGGPLFRMFVWTHLEKPPTGLLGRRIGAVLFISWLPLLVLTSLAGQAIGGPGVPFLFDLDAQIRCLAFIPLLLGAEVVVHNRIVNVVRQFINRGLISLEDRERFEKIVVDSLRLRNSIFAEVALLVLAVAAGYLIWQRHVALSVVTWFAAPVNGQLQFTPAGYWYFFVSLVITRFLWFRWYFRIMIWYSFLWKVSRRIPLALNALHPDRAGGLGFLANSVFAFAPLLAAHTLLLAGVIGGKIWHEGAVLPQFKMEIVAWIVFLMLLAITPLFFFMGQLAAARRKGLVEYGILASRLVTEFRNKWIVNHPPKEETLVGNADIQSLADLAVSFETVTSMLPIPFRKATIVRLAIVLAIPLSPLTLTMIPLDQLIDKALRIIL